MQHTYFFVGLKTYIYQPNNVSQEEDYLINNLTKLWEYLNFGEKVDIFNANPSEKNKCYLETLILFKAATKEDR